MIEKSGKTLTARQESVILIVRNGRAICPVCGRETQQRVLPGTQLRDLPLYCKRCRSESIVSLSL